MRQDGALRRILPVQQERSLFDKQTDENFTEPPAQSGSRIGIGKIWLLEKFYNPIFDVAEKPIVAALATGNSKLTIRYLSSVDECQRLIEQVETALHPSRDDVLAMSGCWLAPTGETLTTRESGARRSSIDQVQNIVLTHKRLHRTNSSVLHSSV